MATVEEDREKSPLPGTQYTPTPSEPFPPTFNLYWKHTWKGHIFHLGQHADQVLYLVTEHTGGWMSKKPQLILHASAEAKSPAIVAATSGGPWTSRSVLTLLPEGSTTVYPKNATAVGRSEPLVGKLHGLVHYRYSFTVKVPSGATERYEWRQSHGQEVKGLRNRRWGYKLARMDGTRAASTRLARAMGDRDLGRTSDGKEVVAVWADYSKYSRNKLGCFAFLGSGASGELGRDWAFMAVTSMLRIRQVQRQAFPKNP